MDDAKSWACDDENEEKGGLHRSSKEDDDKTIDFPERAVYWRGAVGMRTLAIWLI